STGEGYVPFPTHINYRMPRCFPAWRAAILYTIGLFFMCLQAAVAKGTDPALTDRAVLVASPSQTVETPSQYSKLKIGQKIPTNVLIGDPVFNSERHQITTRDFRRRAVIIDV